MIFKAFIHTKDRTKHLKKHKHLNAAGYEPVPFGNILQYNYRLFFSYNNIKVKY